MPETREELIKRITKEVLAVLADHQTQTDKSVQREECILVVGDPAKLPSNLSKEYNLAAIEDYARDGDISKYQKVCITSLTFTELSDIALCRDSRPVQCAVINALLCGKEVLMLESGLPHRDFAATANDTMYAVLEGYLRTILGFGVKLVSDKIPLKQADKVAVPSYISIEAGKGRPNAASLITENMAIDLVRSGGVVRLPKHAIVTPSAKDIFQHAKVEVLRDI